MADLSKIFLKLFELLGDENMSLVDTFAEIQKYTDSIKFDTSGEQSHLLTGNLISINFALWDRIQIAVIDLTIEMKSLSLNTHWYSITWFSTITEYEIENLAFSTQDTLPDYQEFF